MPRGKAVPLYGKSHALAAGSGAGCDDAGFLLIWRSVEAGEAGNDDTSPDRYSCRFGSPQHLRFLTIRRISAAVSTDF
jgi:hypothetical protein